jgi:hypothetical protein
MSNRFVSRIIKMLVRRNGRGKSRFWMILGAGLLVGYVLLQPVLEKRFGLALPSLTDSQPPANSPAIERSSPGEEAILAAYQAKQSDLIVETSGAVKKNLADDLVGSRHQKMILALDSGHTVLIAHNIDLADRVPAEEGDTIRVRGEYEYSEQGGVIHWTHHDPGGRHEDGWIEHEGRRYQ